MSRAEEILEQIRQLTLQEQKRLLKEWVGKGGILLQDPAAFFDDWDDAEVDRAYEELWLRKSGKNFPKPLAPG